MIGTVTDVFMIISAASLITLKANSSDFDKDNSSELAWIEYINSDEQVHSSEEYMGYEVGYSGPVLN